MQFANPFTTPGNWYKGNLHTHTTRSDGHFDPEEVVRRYREADYDFLALTDHSVVTQLPDASDDDFLLLLGTEMDGDRGEVAESVHLLTFGLAEAAEVPRKPSVPEAIAWAKDHGGEAVLAHPYWSGLVLADMLRWDGYLGLEVFNTGCHFEIAKGYSAAHWDDLLGRGRRLSAFAVDDSHHRASDHHPLDTARAWVMVKAPELTRQAIMTSLRAGLFYSSWGPTIHDLTVAGNLVTAHTSPVQQLSFVAQRWAGESFFPKEQPTISQATYRIRDHEEYLRLECRDLEGRWAWSNPIFF